MCALLYCPRVTRLGFQTENRTVFFLNVRTKQGNVFPSREIVVHRFFVLPSTARCVPKRRGCVALIFHCGFFFFCHTATMGSGRRLFVHALSGRGALSRLYPPLPFSEFTPVRDTAVGSCQTDPVVPSSPATRAGDISNTNNNAGTSPRRAASLSVTIRAEPGPTTMMDREAANRLLALFDDEEPSGPAVEPASVSEPPPLSFCESDFDDGDDCESGFDVSASGSEKSSIDPPRRRKRSSMSVLDMVVFTDASVAEAMFGVVPVAELRDFDL